MAVILTLVAVAVLSGLAAILGLRLLIPGLMQLIGQRRFADPHGIDGCGFILLCGLLSTVIAFFWILFGGSPWKAPWFVVVVLLAQTLFCLIQLRWMGLQQSRKQFALEGTTLRTCKGHITLQPLCIIPYSHYYQTDAYSGYSYYSLTLHTRQGQVLTNNYTLAEDWEQEREALVTLCPQIDLAFVCEVEPGVCQLLRINEKWLPLLMTQKERVPQTTYAFWLSLTRPQLRDSEERPVEKSELAAHVVALGKAFQEERQTSMELQGSYLLMKAFAAGCYGNPFAMTRAQQEVFCRRTEPDAPTLHVSRENEIVYCRLKPREDS